MACVTPPLGCLKGLLNTLCPKSNTRPPCPYQEMALGSSDQNPVVILDSIPLLSFLIRPLNKFQSILSPKCLLSPSTPPHRPCHLLSPSQHHPSWAAGTASTLSPLKSILTATRVLLKSERLTLGENGHQFLPFLYACGFAASANRR